MIIFTAIERIHIDIATNSQYKNSIKKQDSIKIRLYQRSDKKQFIR